MNRTPFFWSLGEGEVLSAGFWLPYGIGVGHGIFCVLDLFSLQVSVDGGPGGADG